MNTLLIVNEIMILCKDYSQRFCTKLCYIRPGSLMKLLKFWTVIAGGISQKCEDRNSFVLRTSNAGDSIKLNMRQHENGKTRIGDLKETAYCVKGRKK